MNTRQTAAAVAAAPTPVDLSAIKARQQGTWSSGNYAIVGTTLQIVGEELCEALDLRSGAAMVLAGLVASGETVIHSAELIERGYADFAPNVCGLGGACVAQTVGA